MTSNTQSRDKIAASKKVAFEEELTSAEEALTGSKPAKDREEIARRAYHAWIERGCTHGHDLNDWLEAEKSIIGHSIRE